MNIHQFKTITILIATGSLALACLLQLQWLGLTGAVSLGIVWLAGTISGRHWLAGWCLALFTILSALVVLFAASAPLVLFGMCAALLAYDSSLFAQRLLAALPDQRSTLEQAHIRRMLLLAGLSLLVGQLALLIRLQLSFFWLFIVGIAAALALAFVARRAQ